MGPANFHCATLLAADGLSTYTPSEAPCEKFFLNSSFVPLVGYELSR